MGAWGIFIYIHYIGMPHAILLVWAREFKFSGSYSFVLRCTVLLLANPKGLGEHLRHPWINYVKHANLKFNSSQYSLRQT